MSRPVLAARALVLSGGVGHDFAATSSVLAGLLAEVGVAADVTDDVEGASGEGRLARYGLVVVNTLRWRMEAERYAGLRAAWAYEPSAAVRAALVDHVDRGGGLLGVHTASICFDAWPEWGDLLGGSWDWERSCHPPLGPVPVRIRSGPHAITDGLGDFEVEDEAYGFLALRPDVVTLATTAHGGATHPLLWARGGATGGRVVYDALGHGPVSLSHPVHRTIVRRAARWLLGHGDEEVRAQR